MILVDSRNFDEHYSHRDRNKYWRQVELALEIVLERPKELALLYRHRIEDATIEEQILVYHNSPFVTAAQLADVTEITERQLEYFAVLASIFIKEGEFSRITNELYFRQFYDEESVWAKKNISLPWAMPEEARSAILDEFKANWLDQEPRVTNRELKFISMRLRIYYARRTVKLRVQKIAAIAIQLLSRFQK